MGLDRLAGLAGGSVARSDAAGPSVEEAVEEAVEESPPRNESARSPKASCWRYLKDREIGASTGSGRFRTFSASLSAEATSADVLVDERRPTPTQLVEIAGSETDRKSNQLGREVGQRATTPLGRNTR